MLRDTTVDLLMQRLGNRTDTAFRDTIISEMDYVQKFVLETTYPLPWFLLKRDATLATVVDSETIALPTDFIAEWDYGGVARLDADGKEQKLSRQDYDWMREHKDGGGIPKYYDLVGTDLKFRLIPDAVETIILWYFATGISIAGAYGDVNNVENDWLKYAADLVLAETGAVLSSLHLQSPKMEAVFRRDAVAARRRLNVLITAREESSKQQFMEG